MKLVKLLGNESTSRTNGIYKVTNELGLSSMLSIESACIGSATLYYQVKDSKLYFRVYRYTYVPAGKGEDDTAVHCVSLEDAIRELSQVYTLLSEPKWLGGSENRGSSGSLFVVDIR